MLHVYCMCAWVDGYVHVEGEEEEGGGCVCMWRGEEGRIWARGRREENVEAVLLADIVYVESCRGWAHHQNSYLSCSFPLLILNVYTFTTGHGLNKELEPPDTTAATALRLHAGLGSLQSCALSGIPMHVRGAWVLDTYSTVLAGNAHDDSDHTVLLWCLRTEMPKVYMQMVGGGGGGGGGGSNFLE